jgi:hypothetical protein
LPLLSLRRRLIEAKNRNVQWISQRYTELLNELIDQSDNHPDQQLVNEIVMTRQIQEDVRNINTWPFDTAIFWRLVAIVFSVTAIMISRLIQIVLQI